MKQFLWIFGLSLSSQALALTPFTGAIMPPYTGATPTLRVGVGMADPTGFVGSSAGQYASTSQSTGGAGSVFPDKRDPQAYSTTKQGSYGVQSRLSTRALVIDGPSGRGTGRKRVVLLKTDNYLAQDLFLRRIGQLLAQGTSGITREQILHTASHNHSSPYQLTQSAGVWIFQDRYNAIAFEQAARAAVLAIEQANASLKPARMGGMRLAHDVVKANIVGRATAMDGTPAGYPVDYGDNEITVLRFDDLSDPNQPKPLATWLNHGEHPESLDGYHLISGDFVSPLERFFDRDSGGRLLFAQGDVGSAEGPYSGRSDTPNRVLNEIGYEGVLREWGHNGYAQAERAARLLADATLEAYNLIGASDARVDVPFTADLPIDFQDYFVVGPISHTRPTIGNCNTDPANPNAPFLPECESSRSNGGPSLPITPPVPALIPAPAYVGNQGHPAVEENQRIHLQAFRLGEVLLASCACEAQVDLILNLETRTDKVAANIYDGFDWACYLPAFQGNAAYTAACARQRDFYNPSTLPMVPGNNFSAAAINKMRAQVHNDAKGWDAPENAAAAEAAEPTDITRIWGNFTKEELSPALGFKLPVGIGHAGDYNGYTVSYREYANRDHYRKALTAYGPHTADYMVTRLVRMARALKDPTYTVPAEPNAANGTSDEARMEGQAQAAGQEANNSFNQRLQNQPPDAGTAAIVTPATGVKRYRAATVQWRGGSNAVDNPKVVVERKLKGEWVFFADQSGEVQTRLEFPTPDEEPQARAGQFEWIWTANFEAFMPFPKGLKNGTPAGDYRFVINGQRLAGVAAPPQAYRLVSEFQILPWDGITVENFGLVMNGVRFTIPPYTYPKTYASTVFHFLKDDGKDNQTATCKTCTFRPWATSGTPVVVRLQVTRKNGDVEEVNATRQSDGSWLAASVLKGGDTITLPRGGVVDDNSEINGLAHSLTLPNVPDPDPDPTPVPTTVPTPVTVPVPMTVPTPTTVPSPSTVPTPVSVPVPTPTPRLSKPNPGRFGGGSLDWGVLALLAFYLLKNLFRRGAVCR